MMQAGHSMPLVFGTDYLVSGYARSRRSLKLDAPLVFVGYGLVAPEHGRDDYRGLDVKGKIVVALAGAPKFLQSEERAYYRSTPGQGCRSAGAWRSGLCLGGHLDRRTALSLRQYRAAVSELGHDLAQARRCALRPAQLPGLAGISVAGAHKLLGADTDKILAAAETRDGKVKGFALPWSLKAELHSEIKRVESENIVGLLPGSDPKLKNEYVVLSAHLDHLGITPPVNGDSINNGALDNASGVSTTLEVARLFDGKPARRSVLFLIDTAEEKGLIGAEYFAHNPTVPRAAIAADVDLDMPILTYEFTDVVAFGADRSSVGPSVGRAAAGMNVKLSPDPMPDEGIFTRSDHYRFVEQGIPAVFLAHRFCQWRRSGHQIFHGATTITSPATIFSQPIRYDMGAKFARLNYAITRELADTDVRPSWNKGDFFAAKFAGK